METKKFSLSDVTLLMSSDDEKCKLKMAQWLIEDMFTSKEVYYSFAQFGTMFPQYCATAITPVINRLNDEKWNRFFEYCKEEINTNNVNLLLGCIAKLNDGERRDKAFAYISSLDYSEFNLTILHTMIDLSSDYPDFLKLIVQIMAKQEISMLNFNSRDYPLEVLRGFGRMYRCSMAKKTDQDFIYCRDQGLWIAERLLKQEKLLGYYYRAICEMLDDDEGWDVESILGFLEIIPPREETVVKTWALQSNFWSKAFNGKYHLTDKCWRDLLKAQKGILKILPDYRTSIMEIGDEIIKKNLKEPQEKPYNIEENFYIWDNFGENRFVLRRYVAFISLLKLYQGNLCYDFVDYANLLALGFFEPKLFPAEKQVEMEKGIKLFLDPINQCKIDYQTWTSLRYLYACTKDDGMIKLIVKIIGNNLFLPQLGEKIYSFCVNNPCDKLSMKLIELPNMVAFKENVDKAQRLEEITLKLKQLPL